MQIFDDFLDKDNFQKLQNFFMSADFPWYFVPNVSLPPGSIVEDTLAVETYGFNHTIYDNETGNRSFVFENMPIIIETFENKIGQKVKELLRIRMSMKHPIQNFTEKNYNLPHVDYPFPHSTLIFYVNDSDGDTRVFDQYHTDLEPDPKYFTTKLRIKPKANRMLFLQNGLNFHTASNPFQFDRRVVLNLNLIL